jgi:Kef-type K+ transport system membrane component KefB
MILAVENYFNEPFVRLLLGLVIVLVLGRLVGALCRVVKQPVVIGEILAGVMLGPSVLGLFPGHLNEKLFPLAVLPYLKIVSQLGLVLFMFIVGLEVDLDVVRSSGKRAVAIGVVAIVLPFGLGAGVLGPWLHRDYACVAVSAQVAEQRAGGASRPCTSAEVTAKIDEATKVKAAPSATPVGQRVDLLPFVMFLGVAMSGTAFAVLARILAERQMFKIPLGALLIACAALDDLITFMLLAVAVSIAQGGSAAQVGLMMLELLGFVVVLIVVVRPLLERFVVRPYRQTGQIGVDQFVVLLIGLLGSAFVSSIIGVHELIGAFLFGLIVPRLNAEGIFHAVADRIEGVSVRLLLPVFFVVAGQGVNIRGLRASDIGPGLAIVAMAFVGKFLGAGATARVTGLPRRQSMAVGALMNTRGLAELVILAVGRDAGVLTDSMYTMLVIMAVVTTVMTGPLLRLVYPDKWLERDIAESSRAGASGVASDRALVIVDDPAQADPLVDVALAFGTVREGSSVTLVRLLPAGAGLGAVAESLKATQALRKRVEEAGVTCSVVSRVSADPQADYRTELERVAPDAVIVAPGHDDLVALFTTQGADVAVVNRAFSPQAGFVVSDVKSRHAGASLELGARLALHYRTVLDARAFPSRVHRQLHRLGIPAHHTGGGVLIGGGDPNTAVSVFAGERDRLSLAARLGPRRVGDAVVALVDL